MKSFFTYRVVFFYLLSVTLLSSCNTAYLPNLQNVPSLKEKGDSYFSVSGSNFQAAGALTNSLGLIVNLQYSPPYTVDFDSTVPFSQKFFTLPVYKLTFESGLGYYKMQNEKMTYEVFGGIGVGSSNYYGHNEFEYAHSNNYRFFIQPDIKFTLGEYDLILSSRLIRLQFYHEYAEQLDDDYLKAHDVYDLDKQPWYFLEPALTIRRKFDNLPIYLQYLYSMKLSREPLNRRPFTFILGVYFR